MSLPLNIRPELLGDPARHEGDTSTRNPEGQA